MITKEQIIEVLDKWNFWARTIETGIVREEYLKKLKLFLKTGEIIAILGVRRSGKSTIALQLLHHLIFDELVPRNNTLYVNFEDEVFYPHLGTELLTKIYEAYKEIMAPEGKVYMVFDEIQKIKGWEHFVRGLYDRKEKVCIIVTGSSAELLSSEYSTLLTGRHLTLNVHPLRFGEYLKFKSVHLKTLFDEIHNKKELIRLSKEFLTGGGFPKIVLTEQELVKKEMLTSYFNDIIVKDIVQRYNIRDTAKIKNLGLFYATNFCGFVSFNSVKEMLKEKSVETIERYSTFLESSYLVFFNKMFDYSLKKQISNERKVYFIDNGLRNAVAFQFKNMYGSLLENAVYLELFRVGEENVFYHKAEKEVDFVIKKGLKVSALINACLDLSNSETEKREVESLTKAMDVYNLKKAYIVTLEQEKNMKIKNKTVYVLPFYKFCMKKLNL